MVSPASSRYAAATILATCCGSSGVKIPFVKNRPLGIASTLPWQTRAPYDNANVQTYNANGASLWGGIKGVTDDNGHVLTDRTVTSYSGTDYTKSLIPQDVTGVPEPARWAMLLFGMFAIGGVMRRNGAYRVAAVMSG